MSPRPVWLVKSRPASRQRAHFAIFIPFPSSAERNPNDRTQTCSGTAIDVVGTPIQMALRFRSNISCSTTEDFKEAVLLGHVDESHIVDQLPDPSRPNEVIEREEPAGRMEKEARFIQPPRGGNMLAPVDDVTNRRCQEWTMDYLRHLVRKGLIEPGAVDIAHAQRDPPDFGIGLRPVGLRSQPAQLPQAESS